MSAPDANDVLRATGAAPDPFADTLPLSPGPLPPAASPLDTSPLDTEAPAVGQLLDEAFARLRRRATQRERPIPLPWPTLSDALGGGLWSGLHVVVGPTGAGKSQFALQIALHAALHGTPVLYCGLELGRADTVARLIGLLDQQKWSSLWRGDLPDTTLQRLQERYTPILQDLPLHLAVATPYGWSYENLLPYTNALRTRYRDRLQDADGQPLQPLLVVLDFLQLVSGPEHLPAQDLRERVQRTAYAGRAIARDLDAAVVFVSSTARENYRELDGRPPKGEKPGLTPKLGEGNPARFVGLGKESGEIEFAADTVLALAREPWAEREQAPSEGTHIWVALAKTRARGDSALARKGWVPLRFNGGWFSEPVKPADAPRPQPL